MEAAECVETGVDVGQQGFQRVESLREFAGKFEGPLVLEAYCKYVSAISAVGGRYGRCHCDGDVSGRGAVCSALAVRQGDSPRSVGSCDLGGVGGGAFFTESHGGCLDDPIRCPASLCAKSAAGRDPTRVGELDAFEQSDDSREGCGLRQDDPVSSPLIVRGPNYARNKAARERRKNRGKSAVVEGCDTGFWNSCSSVVKQELIDSKARMHIAENNERIRKCKLSEDKDSSVETLIRNIVRISELQKRMASIPNEKVVGWVNNVVSGEVETMASSAPSSVPSFDQLSAKLAASSQSSFELSIKAKDDELQRKDEQIAALKESLQLERAKDDKLIMTARTSSASEVVPRATAVGGGVRTSGVKFGDSGKRTISRSRYAHVDLATVKPNPMPMTPERLKQWNDNHISLTRAQVYEE